METLTPSNALIRTLVCESGVTSTTLEKLELSDIKERERERRI